MQYLKKFITLEEYNNYKNSGKMLLPNVSYISEEDSVMFNPYIEVANVGDVAYWDGNKIQTVALTDYNESMGQAIGVVVIPSNFLPDGKARMIALNQTNESKTWETSDNHVDTSLPNYQEVPITDNYGSSTNDSNYYGYIPSDLFADGDGDNCVTDSSAKYYYSDNDAYIPSPYCETESGLILNKDFIKILSNGNALSDFNGKTNTDVLVGLTSNYKAANYAKSYSDGVSNAEWYLPACGELGVMFARLKTINNSISTLGGITVPISFLWSSSETISEYARCVDSYNGCVPEEVYKGEDYYVRSFACL